MTKLKELEKRLRDEPDNLGLRVALAGAFVEADRRDDAVELYRSVAIAYREQGRMQQAIAVCRSVLELAPDDASCQALLAAMIAEAPPPPPEDVAPVIPVTPPASRRRPPVQGPLAALGAVAPNARPATEPPPKPPPPEPPPLLPPDELDELEQTANPELDALADDLADDLAAHTAVAEDPTPGRGSFANLLPRLARRPSTSDITPLPTPVPYHVAEPTIPPAAPHDMRQVPRATYRDLPPSMRAHMPDELAHVAKLEGIAKAAHQISASLLAAEERDEGSHPVEETGEPIDDGDLLDASEAEGTGVSDFTIANALDADDHGPVTSTMDDDGDDDADADADDVADGIPEAPDLDTHRQPRFIDPHAALDRLGTLRPTMPLGPAARRAAGFDAPKRPSVTRVMVDDEKTKPREVPRQLRPPTAPAGPAIDPLDSALFATLPDAQRAAVLDRFKHRISGVGTTVIRRGESGHGLVLVVRGQLDVHSERADGARVSLEAIGPGDYVGEISLLARAPAPAYVVAAVDCELVVLAADDFYDLIAGFPALRGEVRTTAERRIRTHDQLLRM